MDERVTGLKSYLAYCGGVCAERAWSDKWKLPNHQVLFAGSRANKIIIGEVNPAFIGPPNSPRGQHLFPQPPLIPNCRALLFSSFIQDRRSGFSLISGLWIVCHVSCFAQHLGINQRATSCPRNAHNRCCAVPSILTIGSNATSHIPLGFLALTLVQL